MCTRFCLCLPRVCFPSPVFWQLYGGVNGDLLQEGLMPYPGLLHPEPLPLQKSTGDPYPTGDTQTQFCLKVCGVSGSLCTQGLFEFFEHLWWVWGLILNAILWFHSSLFGLLLCPWTWGISSKSIQDHAATTPAPTLLLGFSALGCGVSPQSCSSTVQPWEPVNYVHFTDPLSIVKHWRINLKTHGAYSKIVPFSTMGTS